MAQAGWGGKESDVEKSISLKEIDNADRIYDTNLNLKITDFLHTLTLPKSFALCQISQPFFFSLADGVRRYPIKNWRKTWEMRIFMSVLKTSPNGPKRPRKLNESQSLP